MSKVAFVGGLLIDGTGAEPVKDSLVLVEDKKIVYAGPKKEYGPDYETHDITGKTNKSHHNVGGLREEMH